MIGDPKLASVGVSCGRKRGEFIVTGGLHYLRGNSAPYFSLTYTNTLDDSGGAGHEEILRRFPQFEDLAKLHLSDINGAPMHAEANGWYWLAGALGGAGERYHGGNSKGNYGGEYRMPTREECLGVFARHCRVSVDEARAIAKDCAKCGREAVETAECSGPVARARAARARWREIMGTMRGRWEAEAAACVARHGLRVFGDAWEEVAR